MTEPLVWITLGQTVYRMVKDGKTKTPEFEILIQVYGREKLMKLYQEEKEKTE